jgi:glutamate-1-semialdehyde 2,1-aminomutase
MSEVDRDYERRLQAVIPGGSHTYSRGADQFPQDAPAILERGEGAYVWDAQGRKFLDYGMGLRAVTLGYARRRVNEAALRGSMLGNSLTRPSTLELRAAELLREVVPSAEMVKFTKSGSSATTAAVKLARAVTDRDLICFPRQQPFFSLDDWFIASTPMSRGVTEASKSLYVPFDYGDPYSLEAAFQAHRGRIAAVIMEPATYLTPCSSLCRKGLGQTSPCLTCPEKSSNFLHVAKRICEANGSLLILDEMITGFRWSLEGAAAYFGVQPDLLTFGKAMANGFAVAAVVGRRDVMEAGSIWPEGSERVFLLSSTHGAEMAGLAAFMETVDIYREEAVVDHLWEFGKQLVNELKVRIDSGGYGDFVCLEGPALAPSLVFRDASGEVSSAMRTLFMQEMIRDGILMPWIAFSTEHRAEELEMTALAFSRTLKVLECAWESSPERFLVGPPVKPVFRQFN